tara:strand:+ start:4948 stop:5148 length:201 start_codon:yes stop_codon:yes gene_type:complete
MAKALKIEIGSKYIINGDIFKLEDIKGNYFVLYPLKVNNQYNTSQDGFIMMKALVFADAELYKEAV